MYIILIFTFFTPFQSNTPIFPIHRRTVKIPEIFPGFLIILQNAFYTDKSVTEGIHYELLGNDAFVLVNKTKPMIKYIKKIPFISNLIVNLRLLATNSENIGYWSYMDLKLITDTGLLKYSRIYDIVFYNEPIAGETVFTVSESSDYIKKYGKPSFSKHGGSSNFKVHLNGVITKSNSNSTGKDTTLVINAASQKKLRIFLVNLETINTTKLKLSWENDSSPFYVNKTTSIIAKLCVNCHINTNVRSQCKTNTNGMKIDYHGNNIYKLMFANFYNVGQGISFNITCTKIRVNDCYGKWSYGMEEYILTVKVNDFKNKNDVIGIFNPPVFVTNNRGIIIKRGTQIGEKIFIVKATDLDSGINGQVNYKINSVNDLEKVRGSCKHLKTKINIFSINKRTGEITTNVVMDRKGYYAIDIRAYDLGPQYLFTDIQILVSVQELPIIFNYSINGNPVNSNDSVAMSTFHLKDTMDNRASIQNFSINDLIFSISGASSKYFSIDKYTGNITLIKKIESYTSENYTLTINAVSAKYPTFQYTFSVYFMTTTSINKLLISSAIFGALCVFGLLFMAIYAPKRGRRRRRRSHRKNLITTKSEDSYSSVY